MCKMFFIFRWLICKSRIYNNGTYFLPQLQATVGVAAPGQIAARPPGSIHQVNQAGRRSDRPGPLTTGPPSRQGEQGGCFMLIGKKNPALKCMICTLIRNHRKIHDSQLFAPACVHLAFPQQVFMCQLDKKQAAACRISDT